jgi:hypothetical protein
MARSRANGEGTVYVRKTKQGKVIGYRGSYWVQTADGPSAARSTPSRKQRL